MGPWMHQTGWDGWGWMLGWHLLGWALLVVAVVAIVVAVTRTGGRDRRGDAERILAERYARGEIDTEEYRSRREALR